MYVFNFFSTVPVSYGINNTTTTTTPSSVPLRPAPPLPPPPHYTAAPSVTDSGPAARVSYIHSPLFITVSKLHSLTINSLLLYYFK